MWLTVAWLGRLRDPWQWHQDLYLLLVLAFWEPILFVWYLLSLDTVGQALDLPQSNVPYLL